MRYSRLDLLTIWRPEVNAATWEAWLEGREFRYLEERPNV